MADQPIKLTPLGNLDKDTDYNFIREGNYVDALDVIKQDDTGNVSGTTQPTQRNKHAFSLGEVVAQNKKYRITVVPNSGANGNHAQHAITIRSLAGDHMVNYNGPVSYPEVTAGAAVQFTSTYTGFQASWAYTGNNNIFNVTYPTLPGSTYPVIEIELLNYNYYNYIIESVGPDDVKIECIQEAIPTDLAGPLKDIGSQDLLGDLFIFSTTQDNEPTETDLSILGVGPLTTIGGQAYYTGPVTLIAFSTPHNLQVGQSFRITNSNQTFLNGIFVVNNVISPTDIGVVTSTAWGNNYSTATGVGDAKIIIHPTGIGEIGIAKKDNASETWSYIRLLRSVELNFVSKYMVDSHAHKDAVGKNLYYTDDYNAPRLFKYSGDYETDGALNFINSKNEYKYDFISPFSSLISVSLPLDFSFIEQQQSGGALMSGNKYYFARVVLPGGDISGWSSSSPGVPVYDVGYDVEPRNLSGDKPPIETSKANVLKVTGNSFQFFENSEIEFAVLEEIEGVLSATVFKKSIIQSGADIIFKHTGLEQGSYTLDVAELAILSESYIPVKAKNIRSIDSRNVLSNIETLDKIDLSKWAKTFKHSLTRKKIEEVTRFKSGEYQFAQASFNDKGFMLNETYRIGCRAYIKALGKTDVFWVDDIKVDALPTNSSNPNDNRRKSNDITNYDLVEQVSPRRISELENGIFTDPNAASGNPWDVGFSSFTGVKWGDNNGPIAPGWGGNNNHEFYRDADGATSVVKLLVPRIVIEDIDFNFVVEGFGAVKEFVDALEFFIADVPNSVKASGLSVLSVENIPDPSLQFSDYTPLNIWANVDGNTGYPEFDGSDGELSIETTNAVYEYPFANGSMNESSVAVNYPICTERSDEFTLDERFSAVKDIVSFYSGDTYLDDSRNYAAEKLVVFGAADLTKNWNTRFLRGGKLYENNSLPLVAYVDNERPEGLAWTDYNKTNSFAAVWHPRGTGDFFKEINIKDYTYFDPLKEPDLSATGRSLQGYGGSGGFELGSNNIPFAEGLFTKIYPSVITWAGRVSSANIPGSNVGAYGVFSAQRIGLNTQMNMARGPICQLDEEINLNDVLFSGAISPSFTNNKEILRYSNRGVFYTQLFTDEISNYPTKVDTPCYSVGSMLLRPSITADLIKHELLCGDTHTQTTVVTHRSAGVNDFFKRQRDYLVDAVEGDQDKEEQEEIARLIFATGFGSGLIFVGQNRVNSNMFAAPKLLPDQTPNTFNDEAYYPKLGSSDWLERFQWESAPKYDQSYHKLPEIYVNAYLEDPRLGSATFDFPTRIVYSERKDQSGVFDEYRFFLPLNRRDLDRTFGDIQHHEDVNGELFTLQDRKYQLQYFNTRGTLQGSNSGVEVVIGDGSVLSRDGQTLSSYGTSHKWAVAKGSSAGGKDVIYWFNQENGLFMRFGADGTVVLSSRNSMRSFSANNTRWTEDQHTPALNYGIRSVWDDRFNEAIWTFIGIRETRGDWGSGNKYYVGDIVVGGTANNYPLDDIPDLYICAANHVSMEDTAPGSVQNYWTAVDKDDPEYYSVFTLAFNELSNGFSTFYSHLPKTYLKWKNKFLSSHPLHRNELYEHRYGYDKWYEYEGVWKESEPFVEGVVNYIPEQSKKFVAIQSLSDNVPDKIEFKTKDHESFLVSADFDPEDNAWRSPIKNDILTSSTSDPNDDTVSLLGSYMRVKFKFFNGAYNKMNNLIIKVRDRLRRTGS